MTLEFTTTPSENTVTAEQLAGIFENPGFGRFFTDHMVTIDWTSDAGWFDARVEPYGPIAIDPAHAVLHDGQEIFEGLKAYRHADGSVWLFRPDQNAARLQRSAARMALPEVPAEAFIEACRRLVEIDEHWVPSGAEQSLYLRPFEFGNQVFLGVRAAESARFMVIASPVRRILCRWCEAGAHLAERAPQPCWQGWHGCCQDWRQLRIKPAAHTGGICQRLLAGAVPVVARRWPHRRARWHEPRARSR